MQHVLNGKIPFLKFFLKQELIWVPLMGIAWWALDFPFMKRFSSDYLRKHPEMKGKDLETTRIACEKFKYTPVTVFNFLEGTRLTPQKHERQQSPYRNLLKPKAGGMGFVLGAMGEQMHTMLDISIIYPKGDNSFWALLSGRIKKITVHIETIPLPAEYLGKDYMNDTAFSDSFRQWVTDLWTAKDQRIDRMKQRLAQES
jgi:1-acyl-sn-glycerol-3-phosphate acyltransferase